MQTNKKNMIHMELSGPYVLIFMALCGKNTQVLCKLENSIRRSLICGQAREHQHLRIYTVR